ncbi:MAG: hypothetical protein HY719_06540 [Planctomycetes bacterium]|nr:hypothetical protein [Planctomycetota bacterium]
MKRMWDSLEQVTYDPAGGVATVTVRTGLYPLEAIFMAGYTLVGRCSLFLSPGADDEVRVQLRLREEPAGEAELEAAVATLAAELLNQVLRLKIAERSARLREIVVARALYGAESAEAAPTDQEPALPYDDETADDYFDDPFGIAVPWEERFGAKAQAGDPATSAPAPSPAAATSGAAGNAPHAPAQPREKA